MKTVSRREMLASTAGAGITGAAALSLSPRPTFAAEEYGLESGLIYLNTGSLGPTPRSVLDAVMKAWAQLETNPVVMAYGAGAAHALADRTREAVAGLIRCEADEVLLTRSTTNAMNIAALGIDLAAGDRVDDKLRARRSSACWKYLSKSAWASSSIVS